MNRVVQWKEREVAVRVIDDVPQQECDSSYAFVYAGHGRTDADGFWSGDLRRINCLPPGPRHDSFPSVVATPTFDSRLDVVRPVVILTAAVAPGGLIEIRSFDVDGKPARDVTFSWHAVVEGELV